MREPLRGAGLQCNNVTINLKLGNSGQLVPYLRTEITSPLSSNSYSDSTSGPASVTLDARMAAASRDTLSFSAASSSSVRTPPLADEVIREAILRLCLAFSVNGTCLPVETRVTQRSYNRAGGTQESSAESVLVLVAMYCSLVVED